MRYSDHPILESRAGRLLALAVGVLWLFLVVGRLLLAPEYIPPGPYTVARWWSLAGALVGFALGKLVLKVPQKWMLLFIAAVASAVFVEAFATGLDSHGDGVDVVLTMLTSVVLYGLPITLILHGAGAVVKAPQLPVAANPRELGAPVPFAPALRADKERIDGRLREIAAQRKRLDAADALLAREVDAETRGPIRAKLDHAREALDEQRVRHRARLWAIDLVRWQHQLAPVADDDHADPRARLDALAAVARDGETMLRTWVEEKRVASTREGERCVAQLRTLLAGCAELRKGIAVQQAMLALRGIEPDEDEHRTAALSTEPLEALQTSLGRAGLADALADLEREHARLRGDQAEARELERILRDLEN